MRKLSLWKLCLYLICALTDCAFGMVMFVSSRTLAERLAPDSYLGLIGACLSLSAGISSVCGGWLADRYDSRVVFFLGALFTCIGVPACGLLDPRSLSFIAAYCLLGVAVGFVYPPLVAWLNQDEQAHGNRSGVSRVLLLFCLSWNFGMLCGQKFAGSLFAISPAWVTGVASAVAVVNLLAICTAIALKPPIRTLVREVAMVSAEELQRASLFKRLSWLANLGGMFGCSLVMHLLPSLMVSIGVSAERHGELLAGWRIVVIATYFVMHFCTFWHYRLSTAVVSQLVAAWGLLVIAQANSSPALMVGLAMFGQLVGYNYFAGIFYSTTGSKPEGRALAAGLHEATLAAGMAIGTLLGGQLATAVNNRLPYLMASVLLLVLLAAQVATYLLFGVRRRRSVEAVAETVLAEHG